MRIIIFSDTHGRISRCKRVIEAIGTGNIDAVIHAGDYTRDAEELRFSYKDAFPVYNVRGNNDFDRTPDDLFLDFEGKRFFVTHGHRYRVKYDSDYSTLCERAAALNADIAVFGHTHCSYDGMYKNMRVLNPGSITYGNTYAVAEIEDGRLSVSIIEA